MSQCIPKSERIFYVGVDDTDIDLFESQYPVKQGMSYNSYIIEDEKIAVMDTVDKRKTAEWLENVLAVLKGKTPSYLIISHMEPDHAGSICTLAEKFPEMTLVGTAKALAMLPNFCEKMPKNPTLVVKEKDTLSLGTHTLQFFLAPMVHWPEVMVSYEQTEQVLFSADAFGKFGVPGADEPWTEEARRYYINIVGKYGMPVQTLLKKAATLDIRTICPLHGPILTGDLAPYLEKYQTWSSYTPEESGVLVAFASIHGNTKEAAEAFASMLQEMGEKVVLLDLARCDKAEAVSQAFRFDRMVLAASSYDGGVFLPMEDFLLRLQAKQYQSRKVGLIENGSWAPSAAKKMLSYLETMKNITLFETTVSIRSGVKSTDRAELETLAKEVKTNAGEL
jgi:flavorubredoxin